MDSEPYRHWHSEAYAHLHQTVIRIHLSAQGPAYGIPARRRTTDIELIGTPTTSLRGLEKARRQSAGGRKHPTNVGRPTAFSGECTADLSDHIAHY